jgi:transketolase
MRAAFLRTLVDLATDDPRIALLTGDLGFMAVEPFVERFPDRFFNVGVAEQNMVGLASGLAEAGFVPFVYSIAPFATLRPYEFIRNGPALHGWPVRIVGVGAGFDYGSAGPTHHALEDLAVMRALPGMQIVAPADAAQTATALAATWDLPAPVYYRIGKDDRVVVPGLEGRFRIGRAETVREGDDLLIVVTGAVAAEAVAAAQSLAAEGIAAQVQVVACIRPEPFSDVLAAVSDHRAVVTVEAHVAAGGLGSLVAEVIAESGARCRLTRLAVTRSPDGVSGSSAFLLARHGLSAECIAGVCRSVTAMRIP